MNRREFLRWVGVGGVASSLPIAIAACTAEDKKSESAAMPKRSDGFQPVGTVAELGQNGQILKKNFARGPVLVISQPGAPKTVAAVNPTCPHKGCAVDWTPSQKSFVCPCHGAKFGTDGKVLKGPAKKPLPTYEAKIEGNSVLVKVS